MDEHGETNDLCDLSWTLRKTAPDEPARAPVVRIADLFSGCGGMTLGAVEALRANGFRSEHALAVDMMEPAIQVYRDNFGVGEEVARSVDIEQVVPGFVGDSKVDVPTADLVLAGPPCQGHSDLNNHTRRNDPRNSLYLKVVRYAELAEPSAIIIENVPAVRHSREGVVDDATELLEQLGYRVAHVNVDASELGVPQRRKRFLLVACRCDSRLSPASLMRFHGVRRGTVGDFIGDLVDEPDRSDDIFRTPSTMSPVNQLRAQWLFDNDAYDLIDKERPPCHRDGNHSYVSMYGRMHWGEPAQTITTGFGSMGQGRFLHSKRKSVITPHEAARLQGFPDFFDFSSVRRRTRLHAMIGNAVPPKVVAIVVGNLIRLGWLGNHDATEAEQSAAE